MGDFGGAKLYLDSTMVFAMNSKDFFKQSVTKNNLAAFYNEIGEYDKALNILEECVIINKQHGWYEQLSFNYANLSSIFSKKEDYHAAFKYLQDYNLINDSLKGAELQIKMVNLNADYEAQKKELVLKESQLQLLMAKRSSERKTWIFIAGFLLVSFGLIFWRLKAKKARREQLESKQSLSDLTRILIDKNSALSEMEERLSKLHATTIDIKPLTVTGIEPFKPQEDISSTDKDDFEKNLYNQRILTDTDWSSFKTYFEKAYPGYLLRLRNAHSNITEAEERMFLFIKLNLTNKEAAAMLGISAESVKKSRQRLRKRINIDERTDLDVYVKTF